MKPENIVESGSVYRMATRKMAEKKKIPKHSFLA
jgi:hypothetical protein